MAYETPESKDKTEQDQSPQGPYGGALAAPGPGGAASPAGPTALPISPSPQIVIIQQAPPSIIDTAARLTGKPRLTVAFPPCSDELLGLVKIKTNGVAAKDDITKYFDEYFEFRRHKVFGEYLRNATPPPPPPTPPPFEELDQHLADELDSDLLNCLGGRPVVTAAATTGHPVHQEVWPSECCICSPCVTLDGDRNALPAGILTTTGSALPVANVHIRRLFIGDLLWLFYFEKMGIMQILGAILDAFACNGRLPISNGSIDRGIKDDIIALVLEVMVRQTKMGMSSTVRDRGCAYRTCLGWVSEPARKLSLDTQLNDGFNTLFHKLIYNAIEFYRERRLAIAIQGAAAPAPPPSVATVNTIKDTIDMLKKRFEAFDYGRNYYNTLSGIVWTIAGMSVIRELVTTLGIAPAYGSAHEFIPAAYDLLVLKRPVSYGAMNRYDLHRLCAENGRDILLDLEVINHLDTSPRGELENWLTQVEPKVEAYRTAFRTLTGVDLGAAATAAIEQAA
jgi:hypothetical protein